MASIAHIVLASGCLSLVCAHLDDLVQNGESKEKEGKVEEEIIVRAISLKRTMQQDLIIGH